MFSCAPEQTVGQTVELPVIWDTMTIMWRHSNVVAHWATDKYFSMQMPSYQCRKSPWWRHQMETFSALLALCAGNSPATSEFPSQRPVTQSLSKQSGGWLFETPATPLWRHYNVGIRCWSFSFHFYHYTVNFVVIASIKSTTLSFLKHYIKPLTNACLSKILIDTGILFST